MVLRGFAAPLENDGPQQDNRKQPHRYFIFSGQNLIEK
jgi:hypothetical protein